MISTEVNFRPITIFAPSVIAGAEKVVITGINSMYEQGFDPIIIVISETRAPDLALNFLKLLNPKIDIKVIDSTKAIDFLLIKKIEQTIIDEKLPIIIHTHGFKALVISKLINQKVPHVHTHHGNTSHTLKVKLYEWLANKAMKRCDAVISVSDEMTKVLLKTLAPYKKIVTIKNMVSLKTASSIREFKQNNPRNSELINLIYVGRISPEKGLLPFLNNFLKSSHHHQFKVTILGDGPDKMAAEEFIEDQNLSTHVEFVGFVSNISDYFKNADALILPSFTEGMPMTILESLAFGVPVIANDVGSIKSLVKHNLNGFITKSNDFTEWDHALKVTIDELAKWSEFSKAEAPNIENEYSVENWTRKTVSLYQEILFRRV